MMVNIRFNIRMRYLCRAVAPCVVFLLLLPAVSQSQDELNPESPAGVEYQLPLEQARKNAGGDDSQGSGRRGKRKDNRRTVALFGAGIVRDGDSGGEGDVGPAGGNGGRSSTSARDGDASGGARAQENARGGPTEPRVTHSSLGAGESDDGSGSLQIVGIALAVLLLGGLLGFGLRRAFSGTSD